MNLFSKILAFLRRLFASLIWFAAAPKDWDPDMEDFEVKIEDGYLVQAGRGEGEPINQKSILANPEEKN